MENALACKGPPIFVYSTMLVKDLRAGIVESISTTTWCLRPSVSFANYLLNAIHCIYQGKYSYTFFEFNANRR